MFFSLLEHYLELYITDTAQKIPKSLYCFTCFTTSIFHGVKNYFLRLWGTGISDAIFCVSFYPTALKGCQGIIFTHGVWMGGRLGKVCPGCISETVRCRKLILCRDVG